MLLYTGKNPLLILPVSIYFKIDIFYRYYKSLQSFLVVSFAELISKGIDKI